MAVMGPLSDPSIVGLRIQCHVTRIQEIRSPGSCPVVDDINEEMRIIIGMLFGRIVLVILESLVV